PNRSPRSQRLQRTTRQNPTAPPGRTPSRKPTEIVVPDSCPDNDALPAAMREEGSLQPAKCSEGLRSESPSSSPAKSVSETRVSRPAFRTESRRRRKCRRDGRPLAPAPARATCTPL